MVFPKSHGRKGLLFFPFPSWENWLLELSVQSTRLASGEGKIRTRAVSTPCSVTVHYSPTVIFGGLSGAGPLSWYRWPLIIIESCCFGLGHPARWQGRWQQATSTPRAGQSLFALSSTELSCFAVCVPGAPGARSPSRAHCPKDKVYFLWWPCSRGSHRRPGVLYWGHFLSALSVLF